MRAAQRGRRLSLAQEPTQPFTRPAKLRVHELDGYFCAKEQMLRAPHLAHATLAQPVQQSVLLGDD
jgi:hypothetical protein